MSRPYDVTLNGIGYMLAKSPDGKLLSGASHAQHSDPFANYFSEQERWKRSNFGMGGGAGQQKYVEGGDKYRWSAHIDTRSGDAIRGIKPVYCDGGSDGSDNFLYDKALVPAGTTTILSKEIGTGGFDGWAVPFTVPGSGTTDLRTVSILVKHDLGSDYSAPLTITATIEEDHAGGYPNGVVKATRTVNLHKTDNEYLPFEDLFRRGEFFWLTFNFTYAGRAVLTLGNDYWLCITNTAAEPLYWADHAETGIQAEYNGGWTRKTATRMAFAKIKMSDRIDGQVHKLCPFRGNVAIDPKTGDDIERLYAAVGPKVMYWDDITDAWKNSKVDFADDVLDLAVFANYLFAAQGPDNDIYYTDGKDEDETWLQATGFQAQCMALHDNILWRADGAVVNGMLTILSWGSSTFTVGDSGTPVTAMVSHGGKLYAAKPEGIFEITYPDLYPDSGIPTCNQVLDFSTERGQRPWILDWHSGCYFPGLGGLYEWKSSILSDVWRENVENEATQWPGLIEGNPGYFQAATGTTRGMLLFLDSPYIGNPPQLLWYRHGEIHPMLLGRYEAEQTLALHIYTRGSGYGLLFYGHGHDICKVVWPTWTDDREMDENSVYSDWGYVWLPRFDGDRPEQKKDWHELRLRTANAGTANAKGGIIICWYRYTDENVFHRLGGSAGQFDTSPFQAIEFDKGSSGYFVDLLLEFDLATAQTPTGTVRLEEIQLVYQPLPDTLSTFQLYIQVRQDTPLHHGAVDRRSAGDIYSALVALTDLDEPFTFIDELGVSQEVRALGITKHSIRQVQGDGAEGFDIEGAILVSLLKISDTEPPAIDAGQAAAGTGPPVA